jgi:hypothetical protein
MTAALALLPIILQYLPQVTVGVEQLIAWINSIRSAASQTGEWTDVLEAQYRASLLATVNDPAWQPDPLPAAPAPAPTPTAAK